MKKNKTQVSDVYYCLQVGRALAAIFVVLFHLGIAFSSDKYFHQAAYAVPFSFGHAGVEFFFVLSGFIITSAHIKDIFHPERLGNYLIRRFIRVYPIYWIMFVFICLSAVIVSSLKNSIPNNPIVLVKAFFLLFQGTDSINLTNAPVLTVAWSLYYEIVFYALFGVFIAGRLAVVMLMLGIFSVLAFNFPGSVGIFVITLLKSPYMHLFLIGAGSAVLILKDKIETWHAVFLVLIGMAVAVIVAMDEVFVFNALIEFRTYLYGIASACLVLGLVRLESVGMITISSGLVKLIGNASFVLYLIHYPMISFLCKVAMFVNLNQAGFVVQMTSFVGILLFCIFVAAIIHLHVERPILRISRNLTARDK